jgi:hypothetical protein
MKATKPFAGAVNLSSKLLSNAELEAADRLGPNGGSSLNSQVRANGRRGYD